MELQMKNYSNKYWQNGIQELKLPGSVNYSMSAMGKQSRINF